MTLSSVVDLIYSNPPLSRASGRIIMPLVFLTKSSLKTLTLGIYTYTADFLANWNKVFAGVTIALLPIIVIYFFFSDRITAGLTSGSVKE